MVLIRPCTARTSRAIAIAAMVALASCGASTEPDVKPDVKTVSAPTCAEGEIALDPAGCLKAGVPKEACGSGFAPDDQGGCVAILPDGACPPGQMAIPGDTACREPSPCGEGAFGDIPIEANTQFVDGSYAGGDSDGSRDRPWTTIQQGVNAAEHGALIAVAAGSYAEDVRLDDKPVRLWGRCSRLVEVVGSADPSTYAAIWLYRDRAAGSKIRGIAVKGPQIGILALGTNAVEIEDVWVHDTEDIGIGVFPVTSVVTATIRGALVEHSRRAAVFVGGADVTLEDSVLRDTASDRAGIAGWGVAAQDWPETGTRGALTMRSSLVERNVDNGVLVAGADATIEDSVVRDTQRNASRSSGRGIDVEDFGDTGAESSLYLKSSLVERNHEVGVFIGGSPATIEATVVRDTQPTEAGDFGLGIVVEFNPKTQRSAALTLKSSLIERSHAAGLMVSDSAATVESTIVRDSLPDAHQLYGRGIQFQRDFTVDAEVPFLLRSSLVENCQGTGVVLLDATGRIEDSVVRDMVQRTSSEYGDGLFLAKLLGETRMTITGTRTMGNSRAGFFVIGSSVEFSGAQISENRFGLVTEEATIVRGNDTFIEGNTERDVVEAGNLAVPNRALPLP